MNHFDVVVMGAGPAGTAAAIHCAQRGLRVALLEKSHFPRHRPGETLHPGVEPLLNQLGVEVPFDLATLRHPGHWVHWDGPPRFQSFGDTWLGFQISRDRLDHRLLEQARTLGVQITHTPQRLHVLLQHSRVMGVQTGTTQWRAHYVLDATGRHRWLQRQLRLPSQRFSPRLIARYGYCQDDRLQDDALGLFAHSGGWHWIARIGRHCLHWTQLDFAEADTPRGIPSVVDQLATIGPTRGADVSWRRCGKAAGPGYFIAGDAVATLDPCASHGVIKALIGGMQAAAAIADCLSWPTGEPVVQAAYEAWVQAEFERDKLAVQRFYQAHPYSPCWL